MSVGMRNALTIPTIHSKAELPDPGSLAQNNQLVPVPVSTSLPPLLIFLCLLAHPRASDL